jgi:hypothetical protein
MEKLYKLQEKIKWLFVLHSTVTLDRRPLWSSGQSSWLQIQMSGFDSQRYHIFWGVVDLERGPLSLLRIVEGLFQGNGGSGLETDIIGCEDSLRWPRDALYPLKLALISPKSGGRSVGTVRLWTTRHGVCCLCLYYIRHCPLKHEARAAP